MATWDELKGQIQSSHKVVEDVGSRIRLEFLVRPPRSQIVWVSYRDGGRSGEWVIIESPIGLLEPSPSGLPGIDLVTAAREVSGMLCGGLGALTHEPRVVCLRHLVPLADLDLDGFDRPMVLVTANADILEEMLTGEDEV